MEEELHFIKRKGGIVLLYNGYQFYKHRVYKSTKTRWICRQKRNTKCTGAITVHGDKIEKFTGHSVGCLSDDAKNTVDLAIDDIKLKAAISTDPIPSIFRKVMAPLYDKGLDKVTKISYDSSIVQKVQYTYAKRKRSFEVKKLVYNNIQVVEIPSKFNTITIADYSGNGIRLIVFGSKDFMELLETIDEYYGDGTFKSAPRPFAQLWSLHGNFGSTSETTKIAPIIYCLMSEKSEMAYSILFDILTAKCPKWEPKRFHCDFEVAVTNALKYFFPTIEVKRCYYHFVNALWRKAKSLGIKTKLYRRIVGLCTALPLLPEEDILDGWNYIQTECCQWKKMKPFMTYFSKYWLKNDNFIKEWCIYNQLHRTNNFTEGWHARLNRSINKNYVTIPKLLSVLKNDLSINKIALANGGNKRRNMQKDKDIFILNTQMKLVHKQITVGHFLEQLR